MRLPPLPCVISYSCKGKRNTGFIVFKAADIAFTGWQFDHGTLRPPPGPGLGVEPKPGLFL